jgi:hypothetical protein
MRSPISYSNGMNSPPSSAVWSTERRLTEKPPPGAPRKTGRRSFPAYSYSTLENNGASLKKHRADRLLLPSSTFDEDDDVTPNVSLNFRPTRLFFDHDGFVGVAQQQDPTTVLLVPQVPMPWYYEMDDDDDMSLSPRLFRFGRANLSRFVAIDVAEDESDEIFRHREELETRDFDSAQRTFSWDPSTARSQDDDRM